MASQVLHAFEVLGPEGFRENVLGPFLEHGTAGNLALACQELRRLSHKACFRIKLQRSDCIPERAALIARLADRFPNATELIFCAEDRHDIIIGLSAVLPDIAK